MSEYYFEHIVKKPVAGTTFVTIVRIHNMDSTRAMAPLTGYFEQYTLDDRVYRSGVLTFHADPQEADRGIIQAGELKDFDGVGDLPLSVKMYLHDKGMGGTYIDNDPIVLAQIEKRGVI
jgi:hypothetical protein